MYVKCKETNKSFKKKTLRIPFYGKGENLRSALP